MTDLVNKIYSVTTVQGFLDIDLDSYDVISFDIWDTVLRRLCHPEETKLASARSVYLRFKEHLKPNFNSTVDLYWARKSAEDNSAPHNDFEYRFSACITDWLQSILVDTTEIDLSEERNQILKDEIAFEKQVTFVDPICLEFLKSLDQKKCGFISDFYLESSHLREILEHHGLAQYFQFGHSSCDHFLNKRSGALYQKVIQHESLVNKQVLHVGDNGHSDIDRALQAGFDAVHYTNELYESDALTAKVRVDSLLACDSSILGLSLNQYLGNKCALNTDDKAEESEKLNNIIKLGLELSPVFAGFILSIYEYATLHGFKTVNFCTREGQFLKQAFDAIAANGLYGGQKIDSRLLEVSRMSTFGASMLPLDSADYFRMWGLYSTQSPHAFCRSMNLPLDTAELLFQKVGISFETEIVYPWKNTAFMDVINGIEFQQFATHALSRQAELVKQYCKSIGFGDIGSKEMIVEPGWRGSIQENLTAITGQSTHGYYFGLFEFLSKQVGGTSKSAWLFDDNSQDKLDFHLPDVAPLEMIMNGPGGSVIGYCEFGQEVTAIRQIIQEEDAIYDDFTKYLQEAILEGLKLLKPLVENTALSSDDFLPIAKERVRHLGLLPSKELSQAFLSLTHNEAFGVGGCEEMKGQYAHLMSINANTKNEKVHALYRNFSRHNRWSQAHVHSDEMCHAIENLTYEQKISLPMPLFRSKNLAVMKNSPKVVGIYMPSPILGSGGHRTICNFARRLSQSGVKVVCFVDEVGEGLSVIHDYINDRSVEVRLGWDENFKQDIAFATIHTSAPVVNRLKNARTKGYFIQDYEALFNAMGDYYCRAEKGLAYTDHNLTIGHWMPHILKNQYGASSYASGLGVDHSIYKDLNQPREKAIAYLYQPEKYRRCNSIAMNALRKIQEKMPDVKIYLYGSNKETPEGLNAINLGLVKDLTKLNEVYNKCQVGLCLSASNPSRIPFELMASGVVPVDLYRYNNLFDYADNTAILAYQSAESICDAMIELLTKDALYQQYRRNAADFIADRSLEWEMDRLVNATLAKLYNIEHQVETRPVPIYTAEAYISKNDRSAKVQAFCDWQQRQANL